MIDLIVMRWLVVKFFALIGLITPGLEFQCVGMIVRVFNLQTEPKVYGVYPAQNTITPEQLCPYVESFKYNDALNSIWCLIQQNDQKIQAFAVFDSVPMIETQTTGSIQTAANSTPIFTDPGSLNQANFQGTLIFGTGLPVGIFILITCLLQPASYHAGIYSS